MGAFFKSDSPLLSWQQWERKQLVQFLEHLDKTGVLGVSIDSIDTVVDTYMEEKRKGYKSELSAG